MRRVLALATLLVVAACSDDGAITVPDPVQSEQVLELTPLQERIRGSIAARADNGLPAPEVSFSFSSDNGLPLSELQGYPGQPGESFTMVATTVLEYDHPREAGLNRWPAMVIDGEVPPGQEGVFRPGDYTEVVRESVEERLPGFWDRYEYGLEPRTRRITETVTVTFPAQQGGDVARAVVNEDLVHGQTFLGPDIDQSVQGEDCVETELGEYCFWKFDAGLRLDYGLGIRLPMTVSLSSDDLVEEGMTFVPTSLAKGTDWSDLQYTAAGIAPEGGNEFVLRYEFFLGVFVEISEITVVDIGPRVGPEDLSKSFSTPFGPGSTFSLPTLNVPIYEEELLKVAFEFGAGFTPNAGSDRFLASWVASSGLQGSGPLVYTDPSVGTNLNSIYAVDGPSVGNIQINSTRYVFNQFTVTLSAYFYINIFGLYEGLLDIPITDFDLSSLIPSISVPIHPGANPTTLNSTVSVQNVAPTAVINVGGAQSINGTDIFFADVGEVIQFEGSSHDPGRDDLTVEWDFGDGSSPVSVVYLLQEATGPNNVTDAQARSYANACFYPISFTSTDSDGASAQDGAAAVIRTAAGTAYSRLDGYWVREFKGNGNVDFAPDELGCMLQIIEATSTVFHELRDASTVMLGLEVLDLKGNQGSEVEKLDRALLVAWLNFANGVFDLGEMVDTDFDLIPDTPFGDALAVAEGVRANPLSTVEQLELQKDIVHHISTQKTGPEDVVE